jgi:hypothetical protein
MRTASAVLVAATLTAAAPAAADTSETSAIVQLTVVEPGDKRYKSFHGAIWLSHDKDTYNYRWGGLQCKGRDLSDSSVQLLFASFRSEYQVTLDYEVVEHKGKSYRCIVGFTVSKT